MNINYKQLMLQHGGSIPFSALKKNKKITINKNKLRSKKGKEKSRKFLNSIKKKKKSIAKKRKATNSKVNYYPGTIIRKQGELYKYTTTNKWIKI